MATIGRPTLYRTEFCERAIEVGREGGSKVEIAADLDVSRRVIDNWCDAHPEFLLAIERARDLAMAWWEGKGREHLIEFKDGTRLNTQLWSRSMAARFPDDYRENSKVELSGNVGTKSLDRTARAARIEALMALAAKRKADASTPAEPDDTADWA